MNKKDKNIILNHETGNRRIQKWCLMMSINLAMNVFLCFAYDNKSKNKRRKQH